MRKFNKVQISNLEYVLRHGGVIPSSEWTNGSGRYVTRRALPPFCELIDVWDVRNLRGEVRRNADRLLRKRPRVQRLVVVTNLRGARAAVKGAEYATSS